MKICFEVGESARLETKLRRILRHSVGCFHGSRSQEEKYQSCMKDGFVFWGSGGGECVRHD